MTRQDINNSQFTIEEELLQLVVEPGKYVYRNKSDLYSLLPDLNKKYYCRSVFLHSKAL